MNKLALVEFHMTQSGKRERVTGTTQARFSFRKNGSTDDVTDASASISGKVAP